MTGWLMNLCGISRVTIVFIYTIDIISCFSLNTLSTEFLLRFRLNLKYRISYLPQKKDSVKLNNILAVIHKTWIDVI